LDGVLDTHKIDLALAARVLGHALGLIVGFVLLQRPRERQRDSVVMGA
jgi:hypothetical protein